MRKYASVAQQRYFHAVMPKEAAKIDKKMTPKQFKGLPKKVKAGKK